MKPIKKFELFDWDEHEDDELVVKYAKYIISSYLDKTDDDDDTLESVFAEIADNDELEEEQQEWVINELQDYLLKLYRESKKVRTLMNIDSKKYNL